jgi:hypothetical protein
VPTSLLIQKSFHILNQPTHYTRFAFCREQKKSRKQWTATADTGEDEEDEEVGGRTASLAVAAVAVVVAVDKVNPRDSPWRFDLLTV